MKLLHIGDVVGAAGSRFLQERLPNIKRTHKIDMTVVNGGKLRSGKRHHQAFHGADLFCRGRCDYDGKSLL